MSELYSFGEWVRRRRKMLDLTQHTLAQRVGCALSMMRKIEADERRPSRQIAQLLAAALELPVDEHAAFLHAARAERMVDQLTVPTVSPPTASAQPQPARPSGTITFLFTDIEGSTRLWEQHTVAMRAVTARHEAILRAAIEAFSGVLVKTLGDGVLAAFARATDAVLAALAAQRELLHETWGGIDAVRVRMALHSGVTHERDGDYYGPVLNRAARLTAAGYGGQILLSLATQELVRDHLPAGVELRDLGEHRLKDLSRPERIFQLVAADLPAAFPPLRTLGGEQSHSLPQSTSPRAQPPETVEVPQERRSTAPVSPVQGADTPASQMADPRPVTQISSKGTNPFYHRGPVRDPDFFFGRAREVVLIAELLRQGQSVAIDGARRFGKTSLLFHLAHPEIAGRYGLESATTRWVYLDGGMLDGLDETWLYGAIDRGLGGEEDSVSYARLLERLRTLATQGQRVVLALDEFELLAGNLQLGLAVFNRLRALAAQLPIQYLTASKLPLLDLTFAHRDTLSSPFFNIFAPLRLALFTDADADALLATLSARGKRPFADETRAFLVDLVGPHPLFLQVAGYHAFAALSDGGDGTLDPAAQASVRDRTLADLEAHLRYYWSELDPTAQYTLAALPLLGEQGSVQAKNLPPSALLRDGRYLGTAVATFVRRQRVDGLLQGGPLLVDLRRSQTATDAGPVHLTPTEFAALRLFLERPGQVISPEEIEAALWPQEPALDPERARGVVKKLRIALGPAGEAIVNRRGQGYLLQI